MHRTEEEFHIEDEIEARRIAEGIRRPVKLTVRRAQAGINHEGQLCRGCQQRVRAGERITIEEDVNCAIVARRFRFWHSEHHPVAVERSFNRLRRQVPRCR